MLAHMSRSAFSVAANPGARRVADPHGRGKGDPGRWDSPQAVSWEEAEPPRRKKHREDRQARIRRGLCVRNPQGPYGPALPKGPQAAGHLSMGMKE